MNIVRRVIVNHEKNMVIKSHSLHCPPTLTLFLTPFLSLFHCGRLSLCFSSYLCRPCQVDHLIDNQGHQPTSKKLPPLNANSNGVHRPIYTGWSKKTAQ